MSQELNGTLTPEANLVGTFGTSGGGGTNNYNDLINKPSINGNTLQGNKTSQQLGLMPYTSLATVATSGSYDDLTNKPTIPAAQVNSDWNSTSGVSEILNKPTLASVATSGSYDDLTNKPTIPAAQVNSDWNSTSGVSEILNKPTLASVATSGDYDDLTNKPTIPTKTSELTNDSWYVGLWTGVGDFALTNGQTGNLTLNEDISDAREILIGFYINIGTIGKRIRKTLLIPRYELYYVGMFFDEMATPTERIYFQLDRVDGTHLAISSCSIPSSLSNVGIKIYYR